MIAIIIKDFSFFWSLAKIIADSAVTSATNSISTDTNDSNEDASQLKMHVENDSKVSSKDRHSCIIGIALSCIDGFS